MRTDRSVIMRQVGVCRCIGNGRPSYMRMLLSLLFLVLTSPSAHALGTDTLNTRNHVVSERPNVIIVLSDDQGYGDFSCHGNPVLRTPALDRLHAESIRFDDFHVSPLCTPTRGQLLTGVDAMRNGAATVLTGRNLLRRHIPTMPEIFAANGYATGIFGKWHLGENYPDRPMDKGFQKSVWHKGWGLMSEVEYDNDYYETRYLDSLETKFSGEYCTNLWFNEAMAWMDEVSDTGQPFFTYLALNAPHGPFYSPPQDYAFYRDHVRDSSTALFLGMIRNIDRNVGRLEKWLSERGLKDNTVIIYMTDNGGTGGVDLYNAGMRDRKGSNYEGGHRAACFLRWPGGGLGRPRTISYPTQVQDILPTLIDLLKLRMRDGHEFDGMTLAPLLRDNQLLDDRMFVVQHGGQVRPEKYFACVVWKSWRLVGENELYNIDSDPGQMKNVSKQFPDVARRMRAYYENWWETLKADVDRLVPHIIDSRNQNAVLLNSSHWTEKAINSQWKIARADGPPNGGDILIRVLHEGTYRISLSRWPFHLERGLTLAGPPTTVGGTSIRTGKPVPIEYGCFSINGSKPDVVRKVQKDATQITREMELKPGDLTLRTWFKDDVGNDVLGAYYLRVEKVN